MARAFSGEITRVCAHNTELYHPRYLKQGTNSTFSSLKSDNYESK